MSDLLSRERDRIERLGGQVQTEMLVAYDYFIAQKDYTGAYIMLSEAAGYDTFRRKLEDAYHKIVGGICVPSSFEWGFYHLPQFHEARDNADPEYLNAVKANAKVIRFKNGLLYGYYCYNVYNKALGWLRGMRSSLLPQAMPMYEAIESYFLSKMAFFMKFEGK